MMNERHTEVLVVGGALTGLSCALFLAWHGVDCLVVERHPDLLLHPRLRGINPRTVEIYRQLGLEQAIRQACFDEPETFEWHAVLAETLADEHYRTIEEAEGGSDLASASPAPFGPIDQDKLEMLLREKARALGAEIRFSTELVSFSAGDEGVHAVLRDRRTGETYDVLADYLIGADGVRSLIREQLGIELDGPGVLYQTITAMVEADLTPALRGREVSIAYLQKPQPFTALLAHEPSGRDWVVATGYDPVRESPDDYDDERIASIVRAAAGLVDVEVSVQPQIRGTDIKVLGFPIAAQLARRFTDETGRVFLAGDAARANPPTGGLGGNTGVQDAHNLAWKLAAVLKGYAGAALLETYEQERRPVGELTMQQAFARFGARMGHGAEVALIDYDSVVMGYRYRSSAVLGAPPESHPVHPRVLCGEPGTRAPHVEISAERSTIDLYGKGFVLLIGSKAAAWKQAARAVAGRLSVPLETYVLDGGDAAECHGIGAAGAVLVRPDGFVAWRRTDSDSAAEAAELEQALRSVLSRG